MATNRRTTQVGAASAAAIGAAAACLRGGGLVAMPTETVYGLAVDATSDAAVASVFAAKGRPAFNPLIAHVLDIEAAREHAMFGPDAERLALAFWPGPLTLVLPVAPGCRVSLLARAGTRHARGSRSRPSGRAQPHRCGRSSARRPLGQSFGTGQPDDSRPRARRPRREDRLDHRRRSVESWTRIDDRRVRGGAETSPARRDPARSDRGGAGAAPPLAAGARKDAERARATRISLCAARPRAPRGVGRVLRRSNSGFCRCACRPGGACSAGSFAVRRSGRGGFESVRLSSRA